MWWGRRITVPSRRRLYLARWILLPYMGLLAGGLSPYFMGLTGQDWGRSLGIGVGLLVGLLLIMALARLSLASHHPDFHALAVDERGFWGAALTFLVIGGQEFHWAFLRGAIWEIWLGLPMATPRPDSWALWLAGAIALVEIFYQESSHLGRIRRTVLLTATTVLFFYVRSFWLCWLLHGLAHFLLAASTRQADAPQIGIETPGAT